MMKITVNEKYFEYVTNDGKQKTTCVLELKGMENFQNTLYGLNVLETFAVKGGMKTTRFRIPGTIKATVTLKPGDTYDEKVGRAEARTAAYTKLDKFKNDFKCMLATRLDDVILKACGDPIDEFDESEIPEEN